MLSQRQELILRLVVDAYLASGKPVPSKEIAGQSEVEWGASTVRSELAALEAAGYLTHPHTSAGRVPTELGYRRHVDLLGGLEQRLGCGTLHVPLDQVPALKRHENAVFGHVQYSRGKVDSQPSSPPIPVGNARRIVPAGGAQAVPIALAAPGAAGSATSASAYSSPAMPY